MRLYVKTKDAEGQVQTLLDTDCTEGTVYTESVMRDVMVTNADGVPQVDKKGKPVFEEFQDGITVWIEAPSA